MTCKEIENLLPAYLEDLLSPEERKSIAEHLGSCSRCSRDLTGLKRADELVHGLGEVDPPPFFEQRIMSRIKEEARPKRGILRSIFFPLYIKVPIQAAAMIMVAVLAIYIYHTGEPEMKQMVQLPAPLKGLEKGQITVESPRKSVASNSDVIPVTPEPTGEISKNDRQQFAASPLDNSKKEETTAESGAAMEGKPSSEIKPTGPVISVREKDVPPVRMESLNKAQDRAGMQRNDKTSETLMPEQKQKETMGYTGAAVGEGKKTISTSSPPQTTAAAAMKEAVIDLTIQVRDMDVAIKEIEARLDQVKARIIERQHPRGSEFLKAEIAAQNTPTFLALLEKIGKVKLGTTTLVIVDGNVSIGIKIVIDPHYNNH